MLRRDLRAGSARTHLLLLSGAIFLLALIVRLVPLGLYVTPDEPIWVLRSVQFLDAVQSGDWQRIPETGHPGVTTMVLGAFGTRIMMRLAPVTAAQHLQWIRPLLWLAPENEVVFGHLAFFLPAARVLVALTVSLALVLAHFVARPRLGARPARLMALLLALDPFFSGHGGLLHTDALQATFALLAVLLTLPPRSQPESRSPVPRSEWFSWVGSGLFLALAGLTKMLGLLVAPGVALAVLLWGGRTGQRRMLKVAVITVSALACLVVLYPPFWADPASAVRSLIDAVTYHEGIGLRPVFFLGRSQVDPGAAFYPVVLLFRLTPPVLLGVLLWVLTLRRDGVGTSHGLALLFPAFVYLVAITFASKKFDRYVLTVVPLLTVVAAIALHRIGWWRWVLLIGLVLPWAWTAVIPLQYASPLLGGGWTAQHIVPLGWSEGTGFAAHRLNRLLPDSVTTRIMSQNVPGVASLFGGEVWPWDLARQGCVNATLGVEGVDTEVFSLREDIYVAGLHQATIMYRDDFELTGAKWLAPGPLPGITPAATAPVAGSAQLAVWLGDYLVPGEPFTWVRAPACYPLTDAQLAHLLEPYRTAGELSCVSVTPVLGFPSERCVLTSELAAESGFLARYGGRIDLMAASADAVAQAPNPLTVRLRWGPQVSLGELELYLALVSEVEGEQIIWAEGGRHLVDGAGKPPSVWQPGEIYDSEGYVPLPLHLPPGTYELVMQVAEAGAWMGLAYSDDSFGGIQMPLGSIRVDPPPYSAPALDPLPAMSEIAWPGMQVLGVRGPTGDVRAGRPVYMALGLERTAGSTPPSLAWELECDGARFDGGVLAWPLDPPQDWVEGRRYMLRFALPIDPAIPGGPCRVWMAPFGGSSASSDVAAGDMPRPSLDQAAVLVGDVQIVQRERIFELPQTPEFPVAVRNTFVALRGADLSATSLSPGESFAITLYWEALERAPRHYTAFVHLVGPDGGVWGQSDAAPAGGRASTLTWLPGEIVVDTHYLTLGAEAPTGPYELYIGMYDAQSGSRVSLHGEQKRLPGEPVRVAELEVIR